MRAATPGVAGCDAESDPSERGGDWSLSSASLSALAMVCPDQNPAASVCPKSRTRWITVRVKLRPRLTNVLALFPAEPAVLLDRKEKLTLVSIAAIMSAIAEGASDGRLPYKRIS